ncbi:hypothetical protein ACFZC5_31105 [Nocardia gamkensis]|uniref:hypothetical protein n=1 Tax=Nocardia gamkensis TaxID=352869 RepID=UPI0036E5815C
MAGDMNPRKLVAISLLAMLISGCDPLGRTPEKYETPLSNHSIQELCDSTKKFFAVRAGTDNLKVSPGVGGKSLTDEIGGGNGCFYEVADGSAWPDLGFVSLFRVANGDTLSETSSASRSYPAEVLTVEGVTVKVVTAPLLEEADPSTALLKVDLTANIDGWEGQLHFRRTNDQMTRDDQTTQTGAQALVNMIHTLKG